MEGGWCGLLLYANFSFKFTSPLRKLNLAVQLQFSIADLKVIVFYFILV